MKPQNLRDQLLWTSCYNINLARNIIFGSHHNFHIDSEKLKCMDGLIVKSILKLKPDYSINSAGLRALRRDVAQCRVCSSLYACSTLQCAFKKTKTRTREDPFWYGCHIHIPNICHKKVYRLWISSPSLVRNTVTSMVPTSLK